MKKQKEPADAFVNCVKITQREHELLQDLIQRKVIVSFDQAAQLTDMSSGWLRTPYASRFLNVHSIGKLKVCSFKE